MPRTLWIGCHLHLTPTMIVSALVVVVYVALLVWVGRRPVDIACTYVCDHRPQRVRSAMRSCESQANGATYRTATLTLVGTCRLVDIFVPASERLVITGFQNAQLEGGYGLETLASDVSFWNITFGTLKAPILANVPAHRRIAFNNCTIIDPDSLGLYVGDDVYIDFNRTIFANEQRASRPVVTQLNFCAELHITLTESHTLRCDTMLLERKCIRPAWPEEMTPRQLGLDPSTDYQLVPGPNVVLRAGSHMSRINRRVDCARLQDCKIYSYSIGEPDQHICGTTTRMGGFPWPNSWSRAES